MPWGRGSSRPSAYRGRSRVRPISRCSGTKPQPQSRLSRRKSFRRRGPSPFGRPRATRQLPSILLSRPGRRLPPRSPLSNLSRSRTLPLRLTRLPLQRRLRPPHLLQRRQAPAARLRPSTASRSSHGCSPLSYWALAGLSSCGAIARAPYSPARRSTCSPRSRSPFLQLRRLRHRGPLQPRRRARLSLRLRQHPPGSFRPAFVRGSKSPCSRFAASSPTRP
jgi:hypothetical protein